ncbi:signal recognition particle protein [Candidatus Dependentiae bacterium]|nr:signal recognition particle protein [Candidatus Dependentiae bacterium]
MFDFLSKKFSGVLQWLSNSHKLTDENIAPSYTKVREGLLEADVPLAVVDVFLEQIKKAVAGQKVHQSLKPGEQFIKIVHDNLLLFLGGKNAVTGVTFQIPSIVMVMGLQGSGKTTTIAKLCHYIKEQAKQRGKQRHILVASVDFYRPAAIDQLEILARQVGVDFYRAKATTPLAAAQELHNVFKQKSYEHLLLDTAGRLHIDESMMEELVQINKLLAPKHKLLVLDAMTGQESLNVAQSFERAIGFDAAILTKMDSDTRGGAAFAFRFQLGKPIAWVGSGEKIEDLEHFVPERMTTRILGMGDLQTLLEKATENISPQNQESIAQKFMDGSFNLNDFQEQLQMLDKMGSMQKILRYLPGSHQITPEMMEKGQVETKRFKAIMSSMTKKERLVPALLDGSRKKRIAAGAGVSAQDVNQLLQRFEECKQFAKMMKKMGKLKRFS